MTEKYLFPPAPFSVEVNPPDVATGHCNGCHVRSGDMELSFGGSQRTVVSLCVLCARKLERLLLVELGR